MARQIHGLHLAVRMVKHWQKAPAAREQRHLDLERLRLAGDAHAHSGVVRHPGGDVVFVDPRFWTCRQQCCHILAHTASSVIAKHFLHPTTSGGRVSLDMVPGSSGELHIAFPPQYAWYFDELLFLGTS